MSPFALVTLPTGYVPKPADFSQETWWLSVIKGVFILVFLLISVLMALWVERRGLGRMQTRPGPNVHGPFGLLQAVADAIKLLFKEDIWTKKSDKFIYILAPTIAAVCAFMIYAVMPFGGQVQMFGHSTPLQMVDMPVAVLYVLAVASLGVYGLVLGGWSASSTYSLLGAVRSSAQVISYELSMGLSLVSVFIMAGSMSTSEIVASQYNIWWAFALAPAFIVYFISMVGEVNRLPFDLPEAEGELIAGHMTEYSSMKFAWFFLAEYINMFNVSAVATTVFFGGWHAPLGLGYIADGYFNTGWWGMLWFIGKVWFFMFLMIWIRGTLLRFRYDQFMDLGWKVLIPISLVWMVIVAILRAVSLYVKVDSLYVMGSIFVVMLLLLIIVLIAPEKKPQPEPEVAFDAFAGGYPVPPLPGQTLPPSPRAGRQKPQEAVKEPVAVTEGKEENDE